MLTASLILSLLTFAIPANAENKQSTVDYEQLYINFFNENAQKTDGFTGFMVTELNNDSIPEVFVFQHSDATNLSHITYNRFYCIEKNSVVEYPLQYDTKVFFSNYLPDNTPADTETFINVFTDKKPVLKG